MLGLELGADDYVSKPFSPREVCARVKAILRRTANGKAAEQGAAPATAGAAALRLDETAQRIACGGGYLALTRYEYLLLATLLRRPGRIFSRAELMDLVWADAPDTLDRTVDAHIKLLRAKLRYDPDAPEHGLRDQPSRLSRRPCGEWLSARATPADPASAFPCRCQNPECPCS